MRNKLISRVTDEVTISSTPYHCLQAETNARCCCDRKKALFAQKKLSGQWGSFSRSKSTRPFIHLHRVLGQVYLVMLWKLSSNFFCPLLLILISRDSSHSWPLLFKVRQLVLNGKYAIQFSWMSLSDSRRLDSPLYFLPSPYTQMSAWSNCRSSQNNYPFILMLTWSNTSRYHWGC